MVVATGYGAGSARPAKEKEWDLGAMEGGHLDLLKLSFFGVVHPALPSSSTEACALGGHLEILAWFLK